MQKCDTQNTLKDNKKLRIGAGFYHRACLFSLNTFLAILSPECTPSHAHWRYLQLHGLSELQKTQLVSIWAKECFSSPFLNTVRNRDSHCHILSSICGFFRKSLSVSWGLSVYKRSLWWQRKLRGASGPKELSNHPELPQKYLFL